MSLPVDLSKSAVETFDAYLFQATKFDPNIRRALIDKISSVFYEIRQDRIKILLFWDKAGADVLGISGRSELPTPHPQR